jgi:hypothetical protein
MVLDFIYLVGYVSLAVYFIFKTSRELKLGNKKSWIFYLLSILFIGNGILIFQALEIIYFYILYGAYFILFIFIIKLYWNQK